MAKEQTTETPTASALLRESASLLSSVINAVTEQFIISTDAEGRINVFNRGAERILGIAAHDLLGRDLVAALGHLFFLGLPRSPGPADPLTCGQRLLTSLAEIGLDAMVAGTHAGDAETGIWTYRTTDGLAITVLLAVTTRHAAAGQVDGYVFVGTDVTKTHEQARLKDDFVGLISHELRTPLSSILGYLELIADDEDNPLSQQQLHSLSVVDRNARRLLRLEGDLLFTALAESEIFNLQEQVVDLREVAAAAVESAQPAAALSKVQLVLSMTDEPTEVSGDPVRLGQACDNVLSNAIKFTQPGGRVAVTLTQMPREPENPRGRALISVSDTGIGIPAAEVDRLFSRFFRASTATANAIQGVGLSLAITKTIVSAHHGSVGVASTVGEGTTFSLVLPLAVGGDRPVSTGIDSATADLIVAEVTAAVYEYDDALVRNDLAALREWFADSPDTLRADAHGVLVGREAIDRFRQASGGAPSREVQRLHVVPLQTGAAVAVAETVRAGGARGLQMQAWVKRPEGWRISVARVSTSPSATAAPGQQTKGRATADECDDRVLWRVRGQPLVRGAQGGKLHGLTVAVKDLFAVAGHRIGAGNPTWLAESPTQLTNASVVQSLLAVGANITGIVQTDEFAYSLGGTNAHYGTPRNPAAAGRIPGGSSSGPASAVALGLVDVGLGTDTAGSIRVPASYCGLYGFRPSHGVLAVQGMLPLAPSFDTVGWLARDAVTFQRVAEVLLPPTDRVPMSRMLVADDVFALADPDVEVAVRRFAHALAARLEVRLEVVPSLCEGELDHWLAAFTLVQAAEAWQVHGQWLSTHPHALEPEIAERFARGKVITAQQRADAERVLMRAAGLLRDRLSPGTVLIQPATSTPAPPTASSDADKALLRAGTLRLTCLASIAGLPALALPGPTVDALPVGVCLVGPRGSDANLAALASTAAQTGM